MFINFALFNAVEHVHIIEQMNKQEILDRAVAALNSKLYTEKATIDFDGDAAYLNLMGKRFLCVIRPSLTLGDIADHTTRQDKDAQILYVTINASPKILEIAKMPNVNVMDCAGNFNIQHQMKNGRITLMLANKGEKPIDEAVPKAYPIFLEKGLRVIFYLLLDKGNISHTYRQIQDATGVSIGTVKNIIDGMAYQQFVQVEGNKRFLINTDRLLMIWATNYAQILKPKLRLTRYAFRDEDKRKKWRTLSLPEGIMWGGEPAAAITDGYLTPGEFTIYTDVPPANIMKTGSVFPDSNGDIIAYQKFWSDDDHNNTTPAILTYADLMDTANGRCIEAAQKIKENALKYLL